MNRRNFLKVSGLTLLSGATPSIVSRSATEGKGKPEEKVWVFHEYRTPEEADKLYQHVAGLVDDAYMDWAKVAKHNSTRQGK